MDMQKHDLVPKHRILSEKERDDFLSQSSIDPKNLPRIFVTDPTIKDMKPKPGDVVEICRNSIIAGEIKYYRVVVVE